MFKKFAQLCSLVVAATLAGCGGGGGGGTSAPIVSTSTFPLLAITAAEFQQSTTFPFTISGTMSGLAISGGGTITTGNVTSTTFEGQPALQKMNSMSGSFTVNGKTYPLNTTETEYADTNYLPLGSSGSEYVVVNGPAAIPASAKVNDTGTAFTAKRYTDMSKTNQVGTVTVTFALLPDTATTALVKIIRQYKDNFSTITHTTSSTTRITDTGGFTRLFEDALYANGDNLTMSF